MLAFVEQRGEEERNKQTGCMDTQPDTWPHLLLQLLPLSVPLVTQGLQTLLHSFQGILMTSLQLLLLPLQGLARSSSGFVRAA